MICPSPHLALYYSLEQPRATMISRRTGIPACRDNTIRLGRPSRLPPLPCRCHAVAVCGPQARVRQASLPVAVPVCPVVALCLAARRCRVGRGPPPRRRYAFAVCHAVASRRGQPTAGCVVCSRTEIGPRRPLSLNNGLRLESQSHATPSGVRPKSRAPPACHRLSSLCSPHNPARRAGILACRLHRRVLTFCPSCM